MAIDTGHVGRVLPSVGMDIERGRLVAFAKATGQDDPTYVDVGAARKAGYADLPVPPTFLFAIELEVTDPFAWATGLGVDLNNVLHGSQSFAYHRVAHAGERLTASPHIAEIFSKRAGALEFVVKRTAVTDEAGLPVADLATTVVVQNPEVSR